MIVVSLKMPKELLEKIDLYATYLKINRSEFIRQAVISYIKELQIKNRSRANTSINKKNIVITLE